MIPSDLPSPPVAPLDLRCSPVNVSLLSVESTPATNNESRDIKKSPVEGAPPTKNRRKRKPNVTKKVSTADVPDTDADLMNIDIESDLKTNFISCQLKVNPESSDCETIDKIAQMVSTITSSAPTVTVIEPKKPSDDVIEHQLEQMFADTTEVQTPAEGVPVPEVDDAAVEPPKEKKRKISNKPRKKKGEGVPSKKQIAQAAIAEKLKNGKVPGKRGRKPASESTKDSKGKTKENGKSKVKADVAPFVLIQKDGSFSIVNQTANGDDDAEKSVNKPKKTVNTDKHNKHKAMRGLHVSTLSNKYDADKRDATWVCVFCKLGPHKHKLGDLFGPYIINTTSKDYENCLQDPASDIFRQSNKNKFAKVVSPPVSPEKSKKKRKTNDKAATSLAINGKVTTEELFDGMSKVDDTNYEVWFHEDCIVWCSGVYIIGTKIVGMEAAIWLSTRYKCAYCEKNGAVVSCLSRECRKPAHIRCARAGWKLDDDFKTFCEIHR